MKGYLQRLVANATRRQTRVVPFAGSVFSESIHDEQPGIQIFEPGTATDRAASGSPFNPAVQKHGLEQQSRNEPGTYRAEAELHNPLDADHAEAASAVRQSPQSVAHRDHSSLFADPAPNSLPGPAPAGAQRPSALWTEENIQQSAGPERLMPALQFGERSNSPSAAAQPDSPGAPAASPLRSPSGALPQQKREPARSGNDEVQIHIGRIEVIATPPASARSNSSAPSRFTSLSDYLKRRNGRAG